MVPNSWKISFWSCLGALWPLSWRQDGPRVAPGAKINETCTILRWPRGSKMEAKSNKKLIKNRFDFCNDFENTFSRSWVVFGSKNLSKMRGLRVTFSTLLRICEKYDFKQPSYGFAIFFDFWRDGFRCSKLYFSVVFSKAILRRTSLDFWRICCPNWSSNWSQN